jgi:hypothetical protein
VLPYPPPIPLELGLLLGAGLVVAGGLGAGGFGAGGFGALLLPGNIDETDDPMLPAFSRTVPTTRLMTLGFAGAGAAAFFAGALRRGAAFFAAAFFAGAFFRAAAFFDAFFAPPFRAAERLFVERFFDDFLLDAFRRDPPFDFFEDLRPFFDEAISCLLLKVSVWGPYLDQSSRCWQRCVVHTLHGNQCRRTCRDCHA